MNRWDCRRQLKSGPARGCAATFALFLLAGAAPITFADAGVFRLDAESYDRGHSGWRFTRRILPKLGSLAPNRAEVPRMASFVGSTRRSLADFRPAFWMTVDQARCDGCEECIGHCPVGALAMIHVVAHQEPKAAVSHDRCRGCGACSLVCHTQAMKLEQRRPVPPRPATGSS